MRNGSCSPRSSASPRSTPPIRSIRLGVEVVQHDLVEREPVALGQQGAVNEGNAEPSAADDRELHEWDRISTPAIAFT